MEKPEELEGLKVALLDYREALRGFLPMASEVFEEEVGSLINQCTEAMNIIDNRDSDAIPKLKRVIETVVKRVNEIYEEEIDYEPEEEYDLAFLSYFLYYASGNSPAHVP